MEKEQVQHLYHRAGFGILPEKLNTLAKKSRLLVVKQLFSDSEEYKDLIVPTPEIDSYLAATGGKVEKKDIRELLKKSRTKHLQLNSAFLHRMTNTDAVLRERMTLFWTNHFVVGSRNILFSQRFHNTLRRHALGNFKEFVLAISKEPAMLDYLNNQQNKKGKPNENFARELMELFTLGEGNYEENDIKEAARAFTGWRHNTMGDFRFVAKHHDYGQKTFLGKTGYLSGDDIIEQILTKPECAKFICKKIYGHFVNDIINESHVVEMSTVFRTNYDISALMKFVFSSDWFYEKKNIRSKIKSPIDFLAGMNKIVPFTMNHPKELKYVERLLGQVLFEPPNVAGWSEGRSWVDANTMMVRLKLASVLLKEGTIAFDVKGEFEDSFTTFNKNKNFSRKLSVSKQWHIFDKNFSKLSFEELAIFLLGANLNTETSAFLNSLERNSKQDFCIQLMSLPEYQLC